ncbi:FkbM family methyltransferase [Emcibacter sp. SYSU 3D8]|uniref:FkbM family methyltransferase n=1 Tax=Emcibacter sp. SYSU 3D8 TaxID=3133969 RepID=UPI0031FECB64
MQHLNTLADIIRHPSNAARPVRSVLRYVAWNLARRLIDTQFVTELPGGARILYSNRENYATLIYNNVLFDFETMLFVLHYLAADDLFVDVGANIGMYSILASATAGARSIAIEPVPVTFADLTSNIRLNGIDDRVEARNLGVGDKPGVLRFSADKGGMNHVLTADTAGDGLALPVVTIDSLMAGRDCTMMKMDIEGYELPALRGATATLENPSLKALIVEMNESGLRYGNPDRDVHAFILGFGFRPCQYDPATRTLTPIEGLSRHGLNALYVRDPSASSTLAAGRRITVAGKPW